MSRMSNDIKEVEWAIMSSLEAMYKEPLAISILPGLADLYESFAEFVCIPAFTVDCTGYWPYRPLAAQAVRA